MSISKYDYDIGLNKNQMFINFNLNHNEEVLIDNLLKTFKKTLIKKDDYIIIEEQQLIIYKNNIYNKKYYDAFKELIDNKFSIEEISKLFNLPINIINQIIKLFDDSEKVGVIKNE